MRADIKVDETTVAPIVERLLSQERDVTSSYRTDTRKEYDLLLAAAQRGFFPDLLSLTHRGLRLNKRHVHAPPRTATASV
ncbi:MAG TPA: hypothetical protein VEV84_04760 [Pyrinomonadaceae bacterium]|nr:hypothetical protein [Pyrinomonadaceae bacterium]